MKHAIHRFASWLARKTMPTSLAGGQWSGTAFVDGLVPRSTVATHY